MTVVRVDESNFASTVKEGIVLLDFWAPWCGPCRTFGPIFEAAAARHPGVTFGKVNTEEAPDIAALFKIRSIPTLVVLRDGVVLAAQPGVLPGSILDDIVVKVGELDMDEVRRDLEAEDAAGDAPR